MIRNVFAHDVYCGLISYYLDCSNGQRKLFVVDMALAIGHVYSNLQKFLADVERHEEESNGAFEVQTNETSDGTVITCFCSGALDTSGVASCPATLKALDQKTNGVKVLELFLEHSHPGASGTATKHAAVTDADVDITDDLMEKMLEVCTNIVLQ